jgi:ribA/ribD-fused uncharacterized protein
MRPVLLGGTYCSDGPNLVVLPSLVLLERMMRVERATDTPGGHLVPEAIHFYHFSDPYGYFSNFSPHAIQLDGKLWPTSEHYFQAQKFRDEDIQEQVRQATTPSLAARLGRDRTKPLRRDWEAVKDDVMRRAVRAKFTQHDSLRHKLLATGDAVLVEHTDRDAYWGDGGDGSGKNMLGRLLMELREALRTAGGTDTGSQPD